MNRMNGYLLGALVFIIAIVVFGLQNGTPVSVQFLGWKSSQVPLAVVAILSACAGAAVTFLLDSFRSFKKGQELRRLSKANQKYEAEIQALKAKLTAGSESLARVGPTAAADPAGKQGE